MPLSRKAKVWLVLSPLLLILLLGAWQYVSYLFKVGFSRGARSGVVRKVSVKGPPYCKYLEGELVLQGSTPGQHIEVFTFSADELSDNNPIVQALRKAEKDGARVSLSYRQDLTKEIWWRCNPNEYYITQVEP